MKIDSFKKETLDIFESDIQRLIEVPGIAQKKLKTIEEAWTEHRAIREVMMFLQGHGISTLFAVRIYKEYGDKAITKVTEDPYRLANDFEADKKGKVLFIDASDQIRVGRAQNHLEPKHIQQIYDWYHNYQEVENYVKVASMNELEENDFNLNIPPLC